MTPIVDGLASEFAGTITITRLDADQPDNARLQQQYGLRGHPAFLVLDENGQPTARFFGPQTADTLRQALAAVGR